MSLEGTLELRRAHDKVEIYSFSTSEQLENKLAYVQGYHKIMGVIKQTAI